MNNEDILQRLKEMKNETQDLLANIIHEINSLIEDIKYLEGDF